VCVGVCVGVCGCVWVCAGVWVCGCVRGCVCVNIPVAFVDSNISRYCGISRPSAFTSAFFNGTVSDASHKNLFYFIFN